MNKDTERVHTALALVAIGLCVVVGLALALPAPAAHADLPPRPSPQVPPTPTPKPPPEGAMLSLRVQFPDDWPWGEAAWQALWTLVQWQGTDGAWHDVEGWQGGLDRVSVDADGAVTGEKDWWVALCDLGTGPFRWVVTEGQGGASLVTSAPFDLPSALRQTVTVEMVPQ